MEIGIYEPASSSSLPTTPLFFPSLENLTLVNMDNLKGWWRDKEAMAGDETTSSTATNEKWRQHPLLPSFPKLSTLLVHGFLNLTSLPRCQHVEELALVKVNEKLPVLKIMENPM
ncbi:hypothetical protein Ancab_026075, partial [Ancistrocladus abbreviatus]